MKSNFKSFLEMFKNTDNLGYPGFHGDINLINLIFRLTSDVNQFIETGSFFGHTSYFYAKKFPDIDCYTCEIDFEHFEIANNYLKNVTNVKMFNQDSVKFLKNILQNEKKILEKKSLIWLDAHGYGFEWPLKEEVKIITSNFKNYYLFIDDFKVPGLENKFHYDKYGQQECSYEYIKNDIKGDYDIYYPNYDYGTSYFEPPTGWCLITNQKIDLDKNKELTKQARKVSKFKNFLKKIKSKVLNV